jgi:uncharacterized protein YjbI with pentapeptide repeats
MVVPKLAPVRPRIQHPLQGASLLVDEIAELLNRNCAGLIGLFGAPGSGRSTALAHLAHVFRGDSRLLLIDGEPGDLELPTRLLVVCTSPVTRIPCELWKLSPWTRDDCIEYLLALHPQACASVISRCEHGAHFLEGTPDLYRPVLDMLAYDEQLSDVPGALRRALADAVNSPEGLSAARSGSMRIVREPRNEVNQMLEWREDRELGEPAARLLRHQPMRLLAACDHLIDELDRQEPWPLSQGPLPTELILAAGARIAEKRDRIRFVFQLTCDKWRLRQPMACSLLHAAGVKWKPSGKRSPLLEGAYLPGVDWAGMDATRLQARGAVLRSANLSESSLQDGDLAGADLERANLHGCCLTKVDAEAACFAFADLSFIRAGDACFRRANFRHARLEGGLYSRANFSGADLRDACLALAKLNRAQFSRALIDGADFTGADLSAAQLNGLSLKSANFAGALFEDTCFRECNLEGMELPGASFLGADFRSAILTGSRIPSGKFRDADFRYARLADIDWENADLRDTDLRWCTFHFGTTRSGLVGSPLACEGSRTGFYTDEFEEWMFKAPEEVRKANLCGVDLRGADLEHTDFYLVDLRGARFSSEQEQHLRRTGAILKARV